MAKDNELEPLGAQYPVLAGPGSDLAEIISENIGEGGISPLDLDRVRIPAGGGTSWEVPSLEGTEAVKELEGIVIAWSGPRVYWSVGLDDRDDGEVGAPDCYSDDGKVGIGMFGAGSEGNPTGSCGDCPMAQWGSKDPDPTVKAGAPACREQRLLYLLRPDSLLPMIVVLPPTSIRPFRGYMMRLSNAAVPYYGVTTKMALEQQKSGAMKWSTVVPTLGRRLSEDEVKAVAEYRTSLGVDAAGSIGGGARAAGDAYASDASDGE